MNKAKSYILLFALVSVFAVSAISCQKAEPEEEVSGRPTMSDENKKAIEDQVKELDAAYDVNRISGVYDTVDSASTIWTMSIFAAGSTGALADTAYGVWANSTGGGILEGKVTKEGKFAGEWKTVDGSYGKVILVFKESEDGKMTFTGTWGTGVSATNGGTWTGTETANSDLTKDEIAELKAQYASMEEEADQAQEEGEVIE